jgi:hypothetical protein
MLRVAIAGGALALALWVAAEVGVRLAVPWASNMAETSKAVFLDGLVTLELEAEDMAMAQDWAERNANALQRALASIASEARGAVADTVDAALNAYIILVAVLTMLAFAAGMYSRGLLAILIPLLWWLSGELIPDTADQIASSQPLAIKFSLAALAVSLVIAILSNVLGKRASQRDERECSECFLLADNDARFCKGCGKPLEGDQPLWG